MLKRLPIGLSSWAQIRREELFFCDKTDQLPQLVQHFPRAFLSAPRHLGAAAKLYFVRSLPSCTARARSCFMTPRLSFAGRKVIKLRS